VLINRKRPITRKPRCLSHFRAQVTFSGVGRNENLFLTRAMRGFFPRRGGCGDDSMFVF
jgi:hypothetical protein